MTYASECPDGLNLSFQYPKDERAANLARHEEYTPEQWNAYCAQKAMERSEMIHAAVETISQEFVCYQYRDNGQSVCYQDAGWDLFFWCNDFYNTMRGMGLTGRDYSHTTLTFNEKHDLSCRQRICNRVMEILEGKFHDDPGLYLRIQYQAQLDETKIDDAVKEILPQLLDRPCHYGQMSGKIVQTAQGVLFKKKYAKTRAYRLSNLALLRIWWGLHGQTDEIEVLYV